MAGRVRVREITSEEGNRLLRIVRRSSGSVVTWRRAQMVLLSAQGMDVSKIASVAFTSPDRVREVIHNFNDDGFDSLYPKYAGGRPLTFTLPQRREIRKVALSRPMDHGLPFSVWSLTKLADFLVAEGVVDDISHEGLRVLLREEGVSFQVIKTWKQSTDPDFEAKKNRVLELYDIAEGTTDPQDGDPEVVLCMDEFGPLNLLPRPGKQWAPQASKTTKGSRKDPRRRRRRATYTKTLGVRHLFAACDLGTDKIYGHIKPNKKRGTFLVFCRYLRTLYPPEVRIGIVLDNFSPHLSTRVDTRVGDWAEANNVEFSYVPTNASWLNRIEAQFQALRYFTLDGTDHRTHEEQNSMIRRYIKWRNTNAHDETGSPWVSWRRSSVECSSGPVKTQPRHHRVLIGRESTTTWTASKQLPRRIRVLSASPEDAHCVPVTHCNPWYIRAISAPPARLERATYGLEVRSDRFRSFLAMPEFRAETRAAVAFLG